MILALSHTTKIYRNLFDRLLPATRHHASYPPSTPFAKHRPCIPFGGGCYLNHIYGPTANRNQNRKNNNHRTCPEILDSSSVDLYRYNLHLISRTA